MLVDANDLIRWHRILEASLLWSSLPLTTDSQMRQKHMSHFAASEIRKALSQPTVSECSTSINKEVDIAGLKSMIDSYNSILQDLPDTIKIK